MNSFRTYHPLVNFTYFTLVIVFSMIFMHPACLVISLMAGLTYSIVLNGKKALRFTLVYLLPMLLLTAVINPAFNHEGATILTYLRDGNPLTLESIVYGIAAALMLITVISWFSCYNAVMTSDKFIYLFGKVIPALSLVLSMVLRFVPKFKAQLKVVTSAQKCIGRDVGSGKLLGRIRNGIKILSIMVTWSLENAIETADSMKSRGYGLPGRTAYSIFTFRLRDIKALLCILLSAGYVLMGAFSGALDFTYFPAIGKSTPSFYSISIFFAYLVLTVIPILIELYEELKWKAIKSNI